ncbi:MAG: glycoside hydrolase family 78 protein [Bacteroidales bacterium]|nr:glycoside hydrolase family 78 protein [Bacteroidales bacterium]
MLKTFALKTEYRVNPVGIDATKPRLSWEVESDIQNTLQSAYQVQSAYSEEDLIKGKNMLWDTGKIFSDNSVHIEYSGKIPGACQRIYWRVKIWDNHSRESEWSTHAFWEAGLMNNAEWKARWIEPGFEEDTSVSVPSPYLRREFNLGKKVVRARIYVSSHGLYQLWLNGKKVSEDLFTPGWTSYHHRIQYQVYDVTNLLEQGENALGAILGDGWYRGFFGWQGKKNIYGEKLALILQMRVLFEDGNDYLLITDRHWKSSTGPILMSDIYNGEIYDARLEIDGWNMPGFDDHKWYSVNEAEYPIDVLASSDCQPVLCTGVLEPVKKIITPKGETVFDFGQNLTGWVRFSLKAGHGDKITLKHAEVLDKEGNFYTQNLRAAKAQDTYFFKGGGTETYEPRFTFHGFRYLKIEDFQGEVKCEDLSAMVIHSGFAETGSFECSEPLVNQLQHNIQWGLRGNFLDVPTDCPQRDERLGWTGDAQVFAPTACFNMDVCCFFEKWLKDLAADQRVDGSVPWVVPMIVDGGGCTGWSDGYGATGWADAAVIIPWTVYQVYGNKRILEAQYPSMKAWVGYMVKKAGNGFIFNKGFHFGDWLSFTGYHSYRYNAPDYGFAGANTDKDLIATAYFYYSALIVQKIAVILDKKEDSQSLERLCINIKKAFQKEFITPSGRLVSGTQTAYALALAFDLLPEELREIAVQRFADNVEYFGHLTTGFLGTPYLCTTLADNGYSTQAFKLLFNKKYPSWLYPVTMGATTIWERWDGIRPDGSFQDAGMNSFNHYAYGAIGHFLYSRVAGIMSDPEFPGYKRILIKPYVTGELTFVKAEFQSVYGLIKSDWRLKEDKLIIDVSIPSNTTARIEIPADSDDMITENGMKINESGYFELSGVENGRVIIGAGSGSYHFEVIYDTKTLDKSRKTGLA